MIDVLLLTEQLTEADIPIEGCNSNGEIWFLPEATQGQRDQAATILSNHTPGEVSKGEKDNILRDLTRQEAIRYYRRALIDADGNVAALSAIYDQARIFEGRNPDLTSIMKSQLTIWEIANGLSITIPIVAPIDKARYLLLFQQALVIAAIG